MAKRTFVNNVYSDPSKISSYFDDTFHINYLNIYRMVSLARGIYHKSLQIFKFSAYL